MLEIYRTPNSTVQAQAPSGIQENVSNFARVIVYRINFPWQDSAI